MMSDGLVIGCFARIECALRSDGVACWQTCRASPIGVERFRGELALSLQLVLRLVSGALRQRELRSPADRLVTQCGLGSPIRMVSTSNGTHTIHRAMNILDVKVPRLNMPLLVVVSPLENRPAPLSQQTIRDTFDARGGTLALRVEENNFANATAQERILADGKLGQSSENVTLDVVGRQAAVVQRLQEVFDRLEKVSLGIEHRILDRCAVQQVRHLREELQLVNSRLALLAGLVVSHASLLHGDLQGRNLLVDLLFQVLGSHC